MKNLPAGNFESDLDILLFVQNLTSKIEAKKNLTQKGAGKNLEFSFFDDLDF